MTGAFARLRRDELGATSIVVVLLMTVLLISAALVVDVGAIQARKAQLQDAADAAALAIGLECAAAPASTFTACATEVVAGAAGTAADLGAANLNDGQVTVLAVEFPTPSTVRVELGSDQQGYFGRILGYDEHGLAADATAEWSPPAELLSLAMASCAFPAPGERTVVQSGLAVPSILTGALGEECGLLDTESTYTQLGITPITSLVTLLLGPLLPNVPNLNGTTGLVSGGWLTTADCSYDPNLLTTVGATVSKAIPPDCADAVRGWNVSDSTPQRVILPVFDNGLDQLVNDDVLGVGAVDRYAVIDVTGYSFSGLLGLGTVPGSDSSLCRTDGVLTDELTDAVDGLADDWLGWLTLQDGVTGLLNRITGCQALAGTFVGFVSAEEAAAMTSPVRLID